MNRWQPLVITVAALATAAYLGTRRTLPVHLPVEVPDNERERHRRIALHGVANLRDLGGYPAANGQRVRWGVLYRSDHLHHLRRNDAPIFARLNLHALVDFRATFEKAHQPNRLPPSADLRVVELPVFHADGALGVDLRNQVLRGQVDSIDPAALLIEANRQFVYSFTPAFRNYIHVVLAAAGRPVLFHCTGGKDRTGFAAAITLRLLGVPQPVIITDYLLSQRYAIGSIHSRLRLLRLLRGRRTAEVVQQLYGVEERYLRAAFDAINERYGSFEAYVREGLDLDPPAIQRLHTYLLESRP
jgi:protein-tyrosine phosphatase